MPSPMLTLPGNHSVNYNQSARGYAISYTDDTMRPLYIVQVPEEDILDELLTTYFRWGLPVGYSDEWWDYLAWHYYHNNNIGEA